MPRADRPPSALPLANVLPAEAAVDAQEPAVSGGGPAGEMGGAAEKVLVGQQTSGDRAADGLQTRPTGDACGPLKCLEEIRQSRRLDAGVAVAPASAPAAETIAPAAAAPSDAPAPKKRKDTRSALAKKLGWGSPKRRRKMSRPTKPRPAAAVKKPKELSPEELEKAAALQREREDAAIARALQEQLGGG